MPEERPPAGKTYRILAVEDDEAMRKLLVKVLSRAGRYEVTPAADGQEAVERLEAAPAFDLIISDIQMPRMDGEQLLRRVQERAPGTPVIMITAYRNDESVLRCLASGAADYLTKPIRVSALLQTVERALEKRRRGLAEAAGLDVKSEVRDWIEITAPSQFEFVERFQKFVAHLYDTQLTEEEKNDIRVAIDELGQNAVEWGNREDPSKRIRLSYGLFRDKIVFKIEDEGEGFDVTKLGDPSKDPLAHIMERLASGKRMGGYGIFMTKTIMDEVVFSERGNVVIMSKYIGRAGAGRERGAPAGGAPAAGETRDGDG